MFAFPPKTAFGKPVPKSRIYAHTEPTRRIRALFTDQVAEIRWAHKLSPETLHLPTRPDVPEIEVFDITLKSAELDEAVLQVIDRAIPYPVLHRLLSENGVAYTAAFKRPSEADSSQWVVGARFSSGFAPAAAELPPLPAALDLGHLYASLFAPLLPLPGRKGEALASHVDRCERFLVLSRKVDQLTARIRREKQFNRKVALNQELKPLQVELRALSGP
ncbi:hypothetical protein HNR46_004096 [Haloferula luteola]|uniref:DUF4391 domain-containing protein n=1 Tax=Haloferula luteola TaxID=595692 RepID=A0A840V778_9BACT|nr:DUF4391 domain-containing protein [Haloferula luteola]MBB5353832.1 hypothetical protein [Haloferula luteola]